MTVAVSEQSLLQRWRSLPPPEQQIILESAEFLSQKHASHPPRKSLLGLCADLGVTITAEEIDEARHEMWGNAVQDRQEEADWRQLGVKQFFSSYAETDAIHDWSRALSTPVT